MVLVTLVTSLARVLARPLGKVGFDSAVAATDRVKDLAAGAAVAQVAKDQALDFTTDLGAHGAAKASTHVASRVGTPLLSKAWTVVAARAPHIANATRFGVQAGVATSARDQVTGVDLTQTHQVVPLLDGVWAPYVVVAGAIGFSIAFGKLSGLSENKWGVALATAISSFIGDVLLSSRQPGWVWQAMLAAGFGGVISVLVSLTPLGRKQEQANKRRRESRSAAAVTG